MFFLFWSTVGWVFLYFRKKIIANNIQECWRRCASFGNDTDAVKHPQERYEYERLLQLMDIKFPISLWIIAGDFMCSENCFHTKGYRSLDLQISAVKWTYFSWQIYFKLSLQSNINYCKIIIIIVKECIK